MVISNKSNLGRIFLILPIILLLGLFHNPTSASNNDLPQFTANRIVEEKPVVVDKSAEVIRSASETVVATTPPSPQPVAAPKIVTPPAPKVNLGLKIDAIGLNIPLGKTTLGANKELLVPANPNNAAWYKHGPIPGEAGSALVTGHLDSPAGPGVFFNLSKLKPGNVIEVKRDDGKITTFKVDKLESYGQDNTFPWSTVYSTSGASSLRIITCDGVYNPETQRYNKNLVVFASLVSVQ